MPIKKHHRVIDLIYHPLFITGVYALISLIIATTCIDKIWSTWCQDWNFVHTYDVFANYENWVGDVEGSFGNNRYQLTQTLSFWLPALLIKLFGQSMLLLKAVFVLRPMLLLTVFYFIAKSLKASLYMTSFAMLLMLFGDYSILNLSLTSQPAPVFANYYAADFYVFFLLSILFHYKDNPLGLSLCLALGILTHPSMGMIASVYLLGLGIVDKKSVKWLALLIAGIAVGVAAEWMMIRMGLHGKPSVSHNQWWTMFLANGHLNFPSLYIKLFLMRVAMLYAMAVIVMRITTKDNVKRAIKWGLVYLTILLAVYFAGHAMQAQAILIAQPLRFSNVLALILLVGVATSSKDSVKTPAFAVIMAMLIMTLTVPLFVKALCGAVLIVAFIFPLQRGMLLYVFCLMMAFAYPAVEAVRTMPQRGSFNSAIAYVKANIVNGKTFLFWDGTPRGHMFRTLTKNRVIDPRRTGLAIYNELKAVYDDDIKKNICAGTFDGRDVDPSVIYRQGNKGIAKGRITKEKVMCFKREYDIDYVLTDRRTIVDVGYPEYQNDELKIVKVGGDSSEIQSSKL
jgi:hypothetical protein